MYVQQSGLLARRPRAEGKPGYFTKFDTPKVLGHRVSFSDLSCKRNVANKITYVESTFNSSKTLTGINFIQNMCMHFNQIISDVAYGHKNFF